MSVAESAIVGIGRTQYWKRGESVGHTPLQLVISAIRAALDDAGLGFDDVDGFALYATGFDTALLAQTLGIPNVRFTAALTGGGGGSAGSIGLADAAIRSGQASVVVSFLAVQQPPEARFGSAFANTSKKSQYSYSPSSEKDFILSSALVSPGQAFAMLARRHMHEFGTSREHFAEVAISTRVNAMNRETALMREAMTLDDYFAARMISDPLCLLDFCVESDGAVAVVTTTAERARDLRHRPIPILASAHGGAGSWGQAIGWFGMPDDVFASSGYEPVAKDLFARAGLAASDVDVALLYDHFSPLVLLQLEDFGFCPRGQGGPFVADGNIRFEGGSIPVNTHGGNLSEAYVIGMTHIYEAVEQLRGTAVNQVRDAEVALVSGGPASIPVSALLLGRDS